LTLTFNLDLVLDHGLGLGLGLGFVTLNSTLTLQSDRVTCFMYVLTGFCIRVGTQKPVTGYFLLFIKYGMV
jgi:hypothetical protein